MANLSYEVSMVLKDFGRPDIIILLLFIIVFVWYMFFRRKKGWD